MILKAARFAGACHKGQFRKYTGEPYIYHPMRVAGRVTLLGAPEYVVAAAWLHDVVEDCGVSLPQIAHDFYLPEANVARLVSELTNPSKGLPIPRAARKTMDHEHIEKASYWAKVIKAIDRIDNLRDMTQAPDDFKRLYSRESRLLADAILAYTASPVVVGLVNELRALAES